MIAVSKVPDKHVNDVRVIGAGYFFTVTVCIHDMLILVFKILLITVFIIKYNWSGFEF